MLIIELPGIGRDLKDFVRVQELKSDMTLIFRHIFIKALLLEFNIKLEDYDVYESLSSEGIFDGISSNIRKEMFSIINDTILDFRFNDRIMQGIGIDELLPYLLNNNDSVIYNGNTTLFISY